MHGIEDDVIPYSHAETLAGERAGLRVTRIECAHNDCAPEWAAIMTLVRSFLATNDVRE
jgi:hypothetical protein